ncbi:MAG: NAD(P)H-dependent glycerol-3-phosphate dehydrogenase [Firmicutes bacterium]|nr:NAD(P)H-dependent glycerol-3-phosphate dehydrogenase [Bacillota bacterium]MBR3706656.1 NAD(P)H-dependent glycerol-3-phosphate dehydrogenase [Bacillota bacterium]
MDNVKKIGIIGAGSFGTALAMILANKGHEVTVWARDFIQVNQMIKTRENSHYLPGVKLPETIEFTSELGEAAADKEYLVFAVPAQSFRGVFEKAVQYFDSSVPVINVAKGIEKGTLMRLSEVAKKIMPEVRYVALSGPSHAEEVAREMPTTVVVAGYDHDLAVDVQNLFNTERFRVYTNEDLLGVELGGALKNIIALGAGISDGMGFGDNAKAAMMTRGITEMTRLGYALGADMATFSGLAGIGDLIVTCTSMHSRNRRCGILIGQGMEPDKAIEEIGMVVEGISTAEAAFSLAKMCKVEMPITECIYKVIHGELRADDALGFLMGRVTKNEMKIL